QFQEIREDMTVSAAKREIQDGQKSDLARIVDETIAAKFGKKTAADDLKRRILRDPSNYETIAEYLHLNSREISGVQKVEHPVQGGVGIIVQRQSGAWISASLSIPEQSDQAPQLTAAFYQEVRQQALSHLATKFQGSLTVMDYYQPADRLMQVWEYKSD